MGALIAGIILTLISFGVSLGVIIYLNSQRKLKLIKKSWSLFSLLFLLIAIFGCYTSVETGNTGIVTVFGKVQEQTLESGLHFKAPWQEVIQIDNRVQKNSTVGCAVYHRQ